MGLSYNVYLSSSRIFMCRSCKTHLSNHDDILSKVAPPRRAARACPAPPRATATDARTQDFRGQHGKAFLFTSVVNVVEEAPVERTMTTGRHLVRDIKCRQCATVVGWKYDKAYEPCEQYKENKFILEVELLSQVFKPPPHRSPPRILPRAP